jgi:hypothetical protein
MRNFQQKRGWRNIAYSKPFLIFFGVLILFFSWDVFIFWNKMGETVENKKIVENKVALLKQQKETISSEINSLNTTEGKEKFFRENLGLVKEGEDVTVVIEEKKTPITPEPVPSGFFSFFTNWFK